MTGERSSVKTRGAAALQRQEEPKKDEFELTRIFALESGLGIHRSVSLALRQGGGGRSTLNVGFPYTLNDDELAIVPSAVEVDGKRTVFSTPPRTGSRYFVYGAIRGSGVSGRTDEFLYLDPSTLFVATGDFVATFSKGHVEYLSVKGGARTEVSVDDNALIIVEPSRGKRLHSLELAENALADIRHTDSIGVPTLFVRQGTVNVATGRFEKLDDKMFEDAKSALRKLGA